MHVRALTALGVAVVLAAGCADRAGRGGSAGPSLTPPSASAASFGEIADFRLTDQLGRAVTRADLAGRPWLAGFIFTRCSTICPAITSRMSRAQELLLETPAALVSFSVDPEHDTQDVLREYSERVAGADPERWRFLTGEREEIYALIRESVHLAVEMDPEKDPGLLVTHSSLVAAIDGEGRIRGYYDFDTDEGVEAAVERVRFLAGGVRAAGSSPLPKLNATLNASAAILLAAGYAAIRARRRELHGRLMTAAFLVSGAFLASYLYYHFVVGSHVRYQGQGPVRTLYFVVLITHIVGAIVNLPMVLRTFYLALRGRWEDHRRWALRTFPLWMYVSVTGVLVYLMLYTWNPAAA